MPMEDVGGEHLADSYTRLQQQYKTLCNENDKLKKILIGNGIGILIQDLELRYTGIFGEDVLKKCSIQDILTKSDNEVELVDEHDQWVRTKKYVLQHGKTVRKVFRRSSCSKEICFLVVVIEPDYDDKGELVGLVNTIMDVTESSLVRRSLEESENRYRLLFNNFHAAVTFWNKDYRLVLINDYGSKVMDVELAEVEGKHVSELFPKNGEKLIQQLKDIEKNGESASYMDEFSASEGNIWFRYMIEPVYGNGGRLMGFQAVAIDATEQKMAEQALIEEKELAEEREARYKLLFNSTQTVITFWDVDHKFILGNHHSLKLLDVRLEDVRGMNVTELFPGEKGEKLAERFELVKEKKEAELYVDQFHKPTGEVWYQSIVQPVYLKGSELVGYQIIAMDITDKKKAEQELLKQKEMAEESDRLKTMFLQNIAHDIGTPLHAINMFSGFLENFDLSRERQSYFIDIIKENTKQLSHVVSNFLMASPESGQDLDIAVEAICLNEKLEHLKTIFKEKADAKGIGLVFHGSLDDECSKVYVDSNVLHQILTNLLSNAIKFTAIGTVEYGYNIKGDTIVFFVKDTGMGIKKEYQARIFERFYQGDIEIGKNYGGTGLGLSIVQSLVSLLQGEIHLESEYGKGTTFYVHLPYEPYQDKGQVVSLGDTTEEVKTILVVDDAYYNYVIIEELLQQAHVNLLYAEGGREALEVFNNGQEVDLVLMDIKMPGMDGYEVASILKEKFPYLPIIAQSAYTHKEEDCFDAYLKKPFEEEEFSRTLSLFLEE